MPTLKEILAAVRSAAQRVALAFSGAPASIHDVDQSHALVIGAVAEAEAETPGVSTAVPGFGDEVLARARTAAADAAADLKAAADAVVPKATPPG